MSEHERADLNSHGWWVPQGETVLAGQSALREALCRINEPFWVVSATGDYAVARGGVAVFGKERPEPTALPIVAYVPACCPGNLGDPSFCRDYRLNYPYVAGAMAHGINSVTMTKSLAQRGMLSFFGSAGLTLDAIKAAIAELQGENCGFNLIHSPHEPRLEEAVVRLYLEKGITSIEASAYLDISLPLVRYRLAGIHCDPSGAIIAPNKIMAKVSRIELASKFFAPPPEKLVRQLVAGGEISEEQANLACRLPVAQDLTAEADSGGHTDNRPTLALIPTMLALRDRMREKYHFSHLRVGAAGGIGTPAAAGAAFSMGAAYIVTGSVNQSCVESGTSDVVREMLARTEQADVAMAHAADMFEMGVKVQVLKRGTLFSMRSAKLYDIYQNHDGLEHIPAPVRDTLEKKIFCATFDEIWKRTCRYFEQRDGSQITAADNNPKYKMALVFRWYLSQTSHWAISGDLGRKIDYQIWCGPAMGAFNEWVKGTFLEATHNRKVTTVALNLIHGAAVLMRMNVLRCQGIFLEHHPTPITENQINGYLR